MQGSFKSSGGGLGGSGGMGGGFGGMRNPFNQGKLADARRFGIISAALVLISALTEHLPNGEGLFGIRACLGLGSLILLYRAAKGISELAGSDTVSNVKFIIITAIAYTVASILQNRALTIIGALAVLFFIARLYYGLYKDTQNALFLIAVGVSFAGGILSVISGDGSRISVLMDFAAPAAFLFAWLRTEKIA